MSDLTKDEIATIHNGVKEIVDNLRGNTPEAKMARIELMAALNLAFCKGCGDEQSRLRSCQCENDE